MQEKIIEKLNKIKALAEQGIDGEASAAQLLLDKELKRYGLTMDDLTYTTVLEYDIKYREDMDCKLIKQIAFTMGIKCGGLMRVRAVKMLRLTCTALQYAEFCALHDFHKELLKKEVATLFRAYANQHKLFPQTAYKTADELTPEQLKEMEEAADMQRGLSRNKFHKQIEG